MSQSKYFKRKKDDLKPERDLRHAQRETLYIAGADENSSTIISYNPSQKVDAKLAACTYTSAVGDHVTKPSLAQIDEAVSFDDQPWMDEIDMRCKAVSVYDLSRVIISRFMSAGRRRALRLVCNETVGIMSIAYSVLLVNNILPLICSIVSRREERVSSREKDYLVYVLTIPGNTPTPTQLFEPSNKNNSNFYTNLLSTSTTETLERKVIREIIENTIHHNKTTTISSTGVNNEKTMCSIFWAIAVTNEEYLRGASPDDPPLGFRLTTDDNALIQISVMFLSEKVKFDGESEFNFADDYISKFLQYPGSVIEIDVGSDPRWDALAVNITRVFVGGYAEVYLRMIPDDSENISRSWLSPLLMTVSQYFKVCLTVHSPTTIHLTRKSSTSDPFTRKEMLKVDIDGRSIPSGAQIVATIFEKMIETRSPVTASVPKSGSVQNAMISSLVKIGCISVEISLDPTSKDLRVMKFEPRSADPNIYTSLRESLSVLAKPPSDVSPSNYRCADITVRFGSEEELVVLREKLAGIGRVSVLLVGPHGIGEGIRSIASLPPGLEFSSERAVRDPALGNLKNAVRLFVQRSDPPDDWTRLIFETITFPETDSRVTVANRLFSALSTAALANAPFVLLRTESDHSIFVGAMAIVVANGWSRTVQARIETRVVLKGSITYFVTRLVAVANNHVS